jgi:hypothetical protein
MTLLTQAWMIENFGPPLYVTQLAGVLGLTKGAIHNRISDGTSPITTYLDDGKRWADYRDLAEHLDKCRARAKVPA